MSTIPDPRPVVSDDGAGDHGITGTRCSSCGNPSLWAAPRCARCGGATQPATFAPAGVVWSSTVVRVPVPGRTPPYVLAYVDLDDGPRVLAHIDALTERVAPGTPVHVRGTTPDGDVRVEVVS